YFGDDYDTVANAADGVPQGFTNFSPGPLEVDKTYFWRVDEFEVQDSHTGDVWSFTTAKVGGGIRADYYRGMNFDNFALTRTDPRIDFNWGDPGGPDATVGDDNFSARWTGEVEAAFTETYTFYARADDGVRLWVDGRQLVDAWIDQSATEYRGTVDLVAGNVYSLVMEYYENTVDAVAELRWSSPSTPKDFVPQAALAPPVKARNPNPPNRATGVKMTPILTWSPGDYAVSHQVYFGTDADAVRDATTDSPEYIGTMELGSESYDPGKLAWTSTYYWRVDEVNNLNPDGPWVGRLWSFTTGDFLVIDDFEDYDADENRIFYAWHEGLGYGYPGDPPFPGNGTGSEVGDDSTSSYTEETIVHSGGKSMPYWYNNNKQGCACYSEAELTLTAPRDWTEEGVAELSLWFRGLSTNDAEPLYVAVANKTGTPVVVTHDDPAASQINTWTQWVIPLQTIADQGITLTDVDRIIIGVGTRDNLTTPGGAGKMYFDDIRLELPSAVDGE
ncbi:MAG TPA: PA14 domain-containing protein, partial [Sedimentisphaerales bacterium]|nr:PA14 domain-containing protein [Sedimentisphaerales bacterium]